jgi:hypothetical protein
MGKVAVSSAIGVFAGLILLGAYVAAPYAGVRLAPETVMIAVAIFVFGSTVAILAQNAFRIEKKAPQVSRRLGDLSEKDYARFPTSGARLVVRPDTVIEELDIIRHPESYETKDVFLTIKKATGKSIFNPIVLLKLFKGLSGFKNFIHILLVNEHDEFVGYIPAGYARWDLLHASDPETLIVKYIIDVLADPRKSDRLREIKGLSVDECIFDHERVSAALKKVSDGLFRGLVIFKDKRNRKPLGVIYAEALFQLNMRDMAG